MVEWSRALDVRLSEWCCSVSMVWVQIPSREEKKFDSSKNLILTLFGLIFRRIYIYNYITIVYFIASCMHNFDTSRRNTKSYTNNSNTIHYHDKLKPNPI